MHPTALQRAYQHGEAARGHHEARRHSRAAPRVCDAPARSRRRPPHDSTVARPRAHQHDDPLLSVDAAHARWAPTRRSICSSGSPRRRRADPCAPCRWARRSRASRLGWSSRTSCARMATRIVGRTGSRRSSTGRCARSRPAAPPSSAGIGRRVTAAAPCGSPTTPVAIGIVRSARPSPRNGGSRRAAPTCCPFRTSTSSSRCRTTSTRSRRAIRA